MSDFFGAFVRPALSVCAIAALLVSANVRAALVLAACFGMYFVLLEIARPRWLEVSVLADALAAAQSRAVAALGKQYASGTMDEEELRAALTAIGQNDPADTSQWIAALEIIRATGAALPRENGAATPEAATDAQWTLLRRLATEKKQPVPDGPLTKAQAHEIIDTLKAGTYDATKWSVPF